MIYTLTLNTAIDMNISCDPVTPSVVNRTHRTDYCPNGKGVNVARVLDRYNQPVNIMGIFGGFTGRYIVEELQKENFDVIPAWVNQPTRINIFINDGEHEYKLLNPGSHVDDECKRQVLHHLNNLKEGDILVISGSLPPGIESSFYHEIVAACQNKGCEMILDISHPVLKALIKQGPLLIKPNDDELAEIFGLAIKTHQQAREAMAFLHQSGARNILLTMGARGLYFSDGTDLWFCTAPEIELVSSACAGDAALGAFLSVWLQGGDISVALRLASATGADVAASTGLGTFSRVEQLMTKTETVKL
ncbi:6-phosphofructokinase 2 [Izhakiella capsodis]|uniref:Phosphofructokinase n=1 Tax=Izhakiella capsodis TaxID=1367852 RepID=A0A1I4VZV8_9GAMM|nr:1-phosphofructokinase [Izhakiella capsodis]SFN06848.1 6-phosphofructokinase 2 [Izhakiella capsodis]